MDDFMAAIMPHLIELITAVATAILAWLAAHARRRWGIEIEARHRDALHSALMTGVQHALAEGTGGREAIVRAALEYVRRSVPDALAALGPDQPLLRDMAEAKLDAPR